jgi:UDPglucose 6-dehydrogenase
MREAPSEIIATRLIAEGATVAAWDPIANLVDSAPWNLIDRRPTVVDALTDCHAAIIVTEWPELKSVDWTAAAAGMRGHVLMDGRNFVDGDALERAGLKYLGVGRGLAE